MTSSVSPPSRPTGRGIDPHVPPQPSQDPREFRLKVEWELLTELVRLNPTRLSSPARRDTSMSVTLCATPAMSLEYPADREPLLEHRLLLEFPRFHPAMPMEAYLSRPIFHPNVHPETGFVCLWERHRTTSTVEHAIHKTVAILGWRLMNKEALHRMQPEAWQLLDDTAQCESLRKALCAEPLLGIGHDAGFIIERPSCPRRSRLS